MDEIMKDGFERYLAVSMKDGAVVINASSFIDVLAELRESGINEDDVVSITKLDI